MSVGELSVLLDRPWLAISHSFQSLRRAKLTASWFIASYLAQDVIIFSSISLE